MQFARKSTDLKRSARLFDIWKFAAMGVAVVEDDACLSRTHAALGGAGAGDADIPPLAEINSIFATLWFYREDATTGRRLPPIPTLLLELLRPGLKAHAGTGRSTPTGTPTLCIVSDDMPHERAAMIFTADHAKHATVQNVKLNSWTVAKQIKVFEEEVYRDSAIDYLFAVTEEDAASYQAKKYCWDTGQVNCCCGELVSHGIYRQVEMRPITRSSRRCDTASLWRPASLWLFYGCSYMFHLSGDNSRDRYIKGS